MKKAQAVLILLGLGSSLSADEGEIRLAAGARSISGQYIVVLKDEAAGAPAADDAGPLVSQVALDIAVGYGGRILHLYETALRGFALQLPEEDAQRLAADPRVEFIEQDSEAWAAANQLNPPWGIDRVDQHSLPLSGTYTYFTTASNVHVYVIDTGIRASHTQFGGRVGPGVTFVNDGVGAGDCHGHGTHVSGTVGGGRYGVAKAVRLHAVRVLGCSGGGTVSAIIAGVDWVASHRVDPAVATLGLVAGASSALDAAVNASIAQGVTHVVAAGSSGSNACAVSPARVPAAITVAATTDADVRSPFSNFGSCVDLFAPGSGITSAWPTSDTAIQTSSGSSMAAAHAAGVAALYLATHATASPAIVRNALVNAATANVIGNVGAGSPNRLLFTLIP